MNNPVLNVYNDFKKKYGVNVTLNGTTYKAVIRDTTDSLKKKIQMDTGIINFGDYVTVYNSSTQKNDIYLVTEKTTPKMIYDEAEIQICNGMLRYKAIIDGVSGVAEIPTVITVITASNLNVDDLTYVFVIKDKLICRVGYSMIYEAKYISELNTATEFIMNGRAWITTGTDGISGAMFNKKGVILIKLENTLIVPEDDLVNEVAYNAITPSITSPHNYGIQSTIANETIQSTRTYQISGINCTEDGVHVTSPTLTYASSNVSIATVSSTGLITGKGIGNTNIIISYGEVSTQIAITTIEKVTVYTLIGADSINDALVQGYNVADEDGYTSSYEYTFKVSDKTLVTIDASDVDYINLIGNDIAGSFVLTATNTTTNEIYTKTINTLFNAHAYAVTLSETNVAITNGTTHQLVATCTIDGVEDNSPIITYSSDNTAISTVDSSGLVIAKSIGINNITAAYEGNTSSVSIVVSEVPSYKIMSVQGDVDYIHNNSSRSFGIVNGDGTVITDSSFTFSLTQSDKNPAMTPTMLIITVDTITSVSEHLTTHATHRGYFIFNAIDSNGNIVASRELKVSSTTGSTQPDPIYD